MFVTSNRPDHPKYTKQSTSRFYVSFLFFGEKKFEFFLSRWAYPRSSGAGRGRLWPREVQPNRRRPGTTLHRQRRRLPTCLLPQSVPSSRVNHWTHAKAEQPPLSPTREAGTSLHSPHTQRNQVTKTKRQGSGCPALISLSPIPS